MPMTTYTHASLLAAIDRARIDPTEWGSTCWNTYLDTLRAILDLHTESLGFCTHDYFTECDVGYNWPCPTVQVVADALRKMGELDE